MTRRRKIILIVLGILLGIGILGFVGADVALSYLVKKKVDRALAELPAEFGEASCGLIQIRLFSGTVGVSDIRYAYKGEGLRVTGYGERKEPGAEIRVRHIEIGRIFYSVLLKKEVLVSDIRVYDPSVELWMDEKHPELCFPKFPEDTTNKPFPLKKAELLNLHIHDACFALHSLRTKLDVAVDSCSLTVHDLMYDSVFHYCDSVYDFSLEHAAVLIPDGRVRIDTRDLAQEDQGPLEIGRTTIRHTMGKMQLGPIVKEPVTWISMELERVTTSPFNPVRKALANDLTLDKVTAVVAQMDVLRDTRYKPKHPFPMPQQVLMALPVKFYIDHVDAVIKHIHVALASTDHNIGHLDLADIRAGVDHISNKRGVTMRVKGGCPIDQGLADATMEMKMDKACSFYTKMHVTDVDVAFLSPFIRPLVGMTANCLIDTLDTEYKGNTTKADGTFRMLYHGLQIQVYKEDDIPYKIVTRNANTFNTLGNSLIPKSNPTPVDIRPRAYQVEWKYDPWQPFPLYLFGPCIDGVKKTFLPGLYVHMQVKK